MDSGVGGTTQVHPLVFIKGLDTNYYVPVFSLILHTYVSVILGSSIRTVRHNS